MELKTTLALLPIALLSYPALAGAQTTSSPAAAPTEQDDGLADIVVTAQRREERLSQVPISVQAVTGDQILRSGVSDTRMLEAISPSISFQGGYSAAATSLSIRGISSNSQEGGIQPSTALVVDGIPVTRQNEFLFDFADIERVEVLSGPQGTLFGKNATAGVVNVVTKRPSDRFEGSVESVLTEDKEFSLRGAVNVPLSQGVAARLNGFYRNQSPIINNLGPGGDAFGVRSYGISGKLLFDSSSDFSALISGGYSHIRSSYTPNMVIVPITGGLGVLEQTVTGLRYGRGQAVINQDGNPNDYMVNWNAGLELNWQIADDLSLVSVSSLRRSREHGGTDVDSTPIGLTEGQGFSPNPLDYPLQWVNLADGHVHDDLKYGSQEIRLNYTSDRVTLVSGIFLQRLREHRQARLPLILSAGYLGLALPPTTQFFSDASNDVHLKDDTAAIFGDVTFKVTPTFSLFGGLRYSVERLKVDYHRDDYFNPVVGFLNPVTLVNTAPPLATTDFSLRRTDRNLSGRAGVQWKPTEQQNYYFSYNRGYKGAAANISNTAKPNGALLDPEIGSAFELGTKQRLFNGKLSIDLALYHQKINNIQQTSVSPNSLDTNFINAGQLRVDGVELNLAVSPARGLRLQFGGAYTDARYHGGRYPCNPTDLATLSPKCDANGIKSLTGEQAIGSPRYKATAAIDYDYDLSGPFTVTTHAAFAWQSSVQYQLGDDPLTREPKRGILNLSLGVRNDVDTFSATLFVNNVTNKFYYNYLNHADFFIGKSFGAVARDYKRYAGARFSYKF